MTPKTLLILTLSLTLTLKLSTAQLSKPALTPNLDYLLNGNTANLHKTNSSSIKWPPGLIPEDCKSIAEDEGLSPADFEVWDVYYTDVPPLQTKLLPPSIQPNGCM